MMKKIGFFFSFLFFLTFCNSQRQEKELSVSSQELKSKNSILTWVDKNYINCLKVKLPCLCASNSDLTILRYKIGDSIIYINDSKDEVEEFFVKMEKAGEYYVRASVSSSSVLFKFTFKNDTLILTKNGIIFEYIVFAKNNYSSTDLVGKLNTALLDSLLSNLKFNSKEKLNINETTCTYCNLELGNINLISTKGNCENTWILEMDEQKILIHKFLNSCDPKGYPIKIRKKLYYSLNLPR